MTSSGYFNKCLNHSPFNFCNLFSSFLFFIRDNNFYPFGCQGSVFHPPGTQGTKGDDSRPIPQVEKALIPHKYHKKLLSLSLLQQMIYGLLYANDIVTFSG